jgi:beta-phosphoglucomutase-like phosphatase (HAD superfamily)
MRKLAIFSLSSVLRYDYTALQNYLQQALESTLDIGLITNPKQGEINVHDLITQAIVAHGKQPSAEELSLIEKHFTKSLKRHFIDNEDAFEVRPGVQSVFNQIEKHKQWKYCIVSPYWQKSTHLILQSCGVYSKNKFTITASEAVNHQHQIEIAIARTKKKNKELKAFLINEEAQSSASYAIETVLAKFSKKSPNYFIYPKFSELFKKHL